MLGSLILGKPVIEWTGRNCFVWLFGKYGTGRSCICLLNAVYTGTSSEVKVGEECSKPYKVACGLRQGCILSPLPFSQYINSLVNKLKEADVGVMCRGYLIDLSTIVCG